MTNVRVTAPVRSNERPAVALDLSTSSRPALPDLLVSGATQSRGVRICSPHLVDAQKRRAQIRASAESPTQPESVFIDIEIHIAEDAHTARTEIERSGVPSTSTTMRYVGTPAGLAQLIRDVKAAQVADGVTLLPVIGSACPSVVEMVINEVIPLVATAAEVDDAAVASALRRAGSAWSSARGAA